MTRFTEHYRRLLRRYCELTAQSTLTPAEQAEKQRIEAELAQMEMEWTKQASEVAEWYELSQGDDFWRGWGR